MSEVTFNLGPKVSLFGAALVLCTATTFDIALGEAQRDRRWLGARSGESWAITKLRSQVRGLQRRIEQLEKLYKVVVCGRVDSDRMTSGTVTFRVGCDPNLAPATSVDPRLKVTLSRPGFFKFEFMPPRNETPIVIATASDRWGTIPIMASTLRVADVTKNGFTVETFDTSGVANPTNVDFFFAVLGESPLPAN